MDAISTDAEDAEWSQAMDDKAFATPPAVDGIEADDVRHSIALEGQMRESTQNYYDKHYKGGKLSKTDQKRVPLNLTHFTQELLDTANAMIEEMRQYMLPYLDMESKGKRFLPAEVYGQSTLFDNASYGKTMENTLICTRTLAYIDFVEEVKKRIGRPLTATESFLASQMLYDIAIDPQCLYCYVSLDRKAYDEFLLRYAQQRDEVIAKWNASDKSEEAKEAIYKEFLDGRKPTAQMKARFESWLLVAEGNDAITLEDLATKARRGQLRMADMPEAWAKASQKYKKLKKDKKLEYAASEEYQNALWGFLASPAGQVADAEAYAQSASWAKKEEDYRSYTGELLKCSADALKGLMGHYGLRFYSFSEYSPAFILENMQMVRDAAARGLKGFAYTKEIDFIRIFAPTGMNINCSVYGRVDSEGNVVPDTKQGADWAQVQELREQYPNVGAVFVATNDSMVEWALNQPWIDVIIPFHIVRTGADIAKFYEWTNYSSMQSDTTNEGKSGYVYPHEHLNDKETFLRITAERGWKPRFEDVKLSDGRSIVEHPNYMRLVNETRRRADETPILTPVFNLEAAKDSFDRFVEKGAFEEGIETVVEDIKAGKTAKEVNYGRQDVPIDVAKIMAKRAELERKHRKNPDMLAYAQESLALHEAQQAAEGEDVRFSTVQEVNDKFNAELQQQIEGSLPAGHVYQLGMPSAILRATGFPNLPIEMTATRLNEKSKQENHPFNISEVKNLVKELHNPWAVFRYGNSAKNVIIGIEHNGKQFLIGVHFNQAHRGMEVSDIRGIFPKDNAEWLNWISQGKADYLNKKKIQALIDKQRINLAEVEYLDLDSVAKIVNDFVNPSITAENEDIHFSIRTDEQREALFDKAKAQFGLTNNFKVAGYMLPDGSLLDFSEANDGGDPNQRTLDHREIEGIIMDEGREYDSRWMYLADFMNEGAIRLLPEYAGINLMKAPTKEQRKRLFDFIYKYNGEVILEIADERLNNVAYVEYDRRTSPSRIFRDIDGYFNEGIVPQQDIRFSVANSNQAIFVSNAAVAVNAIKMEKATPEQWLKMIEKNGGLKAGEDKWMGLSDWLKASDKKTLTKQEVLDFIGEHMIQIEEQHYSSEGVRQEADRILNENYPGWEEAFSFDWDPFMEEPHSDIYNEAKAARLYNETHEDQVETDEDGDIVSDADYNKVEEFGAELAGIWYGRGRENTVREINGIREEYTTNGLTNLHEIALTVPTIESWKESDEIHFGDAGEGRAVAWIRFGETTTESGERVLVIDEIQSKRHQEGREKGYKSDVGLSDEQERLAKVLDAKYARRGELIRERENENENELTRLAQIDIELDEVKNVRDYDRLTNEADEIRARRENRDAEIVSLRYEIRDLEREQDEFFRRKEYQYSIAVPDAPFEKNWHELAMKRMLRYAAENGYDFIAWTKGDQQAERYDIGKAISGIHKGQPTEKGYQRFEINSYTPSAPRFIFTDNEGKIVDAMDNDGEEIQDYVGKNLSEVFGKDLAIKMLGAEENTRISNDEMRVGGEGMKGFYDRMLPAFMNKYGKKWGIKVEDIDLSHLQSDLTMHSVPVTEEMKASVMEGQVMFSAVQIDPAVRQEMDTIKAKAMWDGTFMKAPNGAETKLTEDQWLLVRTNNFKSWFGDWENDPENASKVVDPETGEPRVVYHGTTWNPMKEKPGKAFFDDNRVGQNFDNIEVDNNFFFTASEEAAKGYGTPVPVFLNIRNMGTHIIKEDAYGGNPAVLDAHEMIIQAHDFGGYEDTYVPVENSDGVRWTLSSVDNAKALEKYEADIREWESKYGEAIEERKKQIKKESDSLWGEVEKLYEEVYDKVGVKQTLNEWYGSYGIEVGEYRELKSDMKRLADIQIEMLLQHPTELTADIAERYNVAKKRIDELASESLQLIYNRESLEGFPKYDTSLEVATDYTLADVYALDNPNQIKSATETTGEFSDSEDIRYSSRFDVNTNPTEAQKKAGNYKMGHLRLDGYNITIENPKGSARRGIDSKGNEWENTLNNDYGYIRGTEGVDGDHIDVYLSDNPEEGNVFVVDQVRPDTGEFDEHKVMYGFGSIDEAREAYLANFSEGWKGLGTITEVTKDEFRKWIDSSHRKTKPFSEYKSVKAEGAQSEGYEEEDITYSVLSTPTDEIVAEGMKFSIQDFARLAGNIFQDMPESFRKEAIEETFKRGWDMQSAIFQTTARLAEKENWDESDKDFAKVIREKVQDAMDESGVVMSRPLTTKEALWMLYRSTGANTDSMLDAAKRSLVAYNLGFDKETLALENEAREAVRFSAMRDATVNAKASMYNRGAVNVMTRLKESFVDMNASVEELVSAIEARSGKKAKGFENILMALNQQSSKGLAAMESYEMKFLNPIFDEIRKIMNETDFTYEDIVRYVILKHGLERNEKLAQRDARSYYQEIYDDIIDKIRSMNAAQKRTYLTNAQLRDADAKAELARLQSVDTSAMSADEKREHKKAVAKAQTAVNEAAEHLERAQKIASMSEKEAEDELQMHFDAIAAQTDNKYNELRKNDYSGITSMFYDQLGVNRSDYVTEEEYQAALMDAKKHKYDTLRDVEGAADMEVKLFEGAADTKGLWKRINAATKETLRQQYEANMISKEQYDNLRGMFEYYVPLRGFKDNTAEDMYTYYRRPNSTGYTKPILAAEGRKTEAESPFGWIASMAGSAIASNVKNEAKLALYYFVSNRPENGIATVSKTWYVHTPGDVDDNGKRIFRPAYPTFSENLSTEEAKDRLEQWQEQMRELKKQGLAYESGQKLNLGNAVVNISEANKPEHIVNVKVAGKDYTIIINGNPRAAQAINGDLNIEATAQDYSAVFGPILRWMSSVNTSYNPEFWITNMMRDMAFTWMAVNTKESPEYRRKFGENYRKAFSVIRMVAKNEKGTLGDSYLEKMYKEFVEYGGVTGYTQIKDNETWEKEIEKYLSSNDPESIRSGKVMRGVKNVFHAAHRFGESLEQVSRFAAFLTSREMGKPMAEAVNDAKEITVNFNRKGSGKMISLEEAKHLTGRNGKPLSKFWQWVAVAASSISPLGRRFIMFFNAAIQGLNATYKLYKANPKRMVGWTLAYAAVGAMNAVLHAFMDDDDDYLDMPQYERRNSLMIGGGGVYLKWALPQEARAFYALGDIAVESIMGRNPHQNMAEEVSKVFAELLPINPAEGWKAFLPSIAVPAFELLLNEDYKGDPIYNEMKWLTKEERERTAKWSNAKKGTGKTWVLISQGLNNLTGGDMYDAGLINIQPEKMEHLVQSAFGGTIRTADKFITTVIAMIDPEEEWTAKQTPFLNRILTINDERFRNVHVNDVFDFYRAEAEHAISLEKKYTKAKDSKALRELRSRDEYKWAKIYARHRKALENINDKLREADGTQEKKELMKRQDELKKKMIKEFSSDR